MAIERNFTGFEHGDQAEILVGGSGAVSNSFRDVVADPAVSVSGTYYLKSRTTSTFGGVLFPPGTITGSSGTVTTPNHKRGRLRVFFRFLNRTWQFANQAMKVAGFGADANYANINNNTATIANSGIGVWIRASDGALGIYLPNVAAGAGTALHVVFSHLPADGVWYQLILDVDEAVAASTVITVNATLINDSLGVNQTITVSRAVGATDLLGVVSLMGGSIGGFPPDVTTLFDDVAWIAGTDTDAVHQLALPAATKVKAALITGFQLNSWETGAYTNVDDVPLNTGGADDSLSSILGPGTACTFLKQSAATVGLGAASWIRSYQNVRVAAGTGLFDAVVAGMSASLTASTSYPAVAAGGGHNPAGPTVATGWTANGFNAVSFGITKQSAAAAGMFIGNILLEVLYTPGSGEVEFSTDDDLQGDSVPLVWSEFAVVVGAFDETYRWAKVDLADPSTYYGGFKEARILSVGAIRRALSDRRGNYEAASWGITVSDTDRLLRGILAGADSRYLLNKYAILRMISDADRRLLRVPRTVAIGLLRDYQPINPFQFQLTFEDYLALQTGLGSQERQIPKRKIPLSDFGDCPVENRNKAVPAIYGDFSSGNSVTAAPVITGDPARGYFLVEGVYPVGGYGNLANLATTPITGIAVAAAAGGTLAAGVYGVVVTAIDGAGAESDPTPFYTDADGGGGVGTFAAVVPTATVDGTQKIQVSWDAAAGAASYKVTLCTYYYGAYGQQVISTASLSCEFTTGPGFGVQATTANITPGAAVATYRQGWVYRVAARMADGLTALSNYCTAVAPTHRRPLRIQWLAIPGALEYLVYRASRITGATPDRQWTVSASQVDGTGIPYSDDDLLDTGVTYISGLDTDTGQVPVTFVGTRVDILGGTWFAFLICGHALKEITAVFQDGVKVDPANYGVTWAVPGQTGFSTYFTDSGAECQYRDINGHRYTLLYIRGPQGDAAAAGQPITVNVKGIETNGDGTGTLITDAFDIQLHAYRNFLFGDYQTGIWPTSGPTWPNSGTPAVEVIDDGSFADAKLIGQARGGYTGAVILGADGEFLQARDWIQRFNLSCSSWSGFNRKSQWFVRLMDDSPVPLAGAVSFTDVRDVFGAPDIHDSPDDLENVVVYSHTRKWGKRTWGSENVESSDATSITNSGQTRKSQTVEMWLVRNATMAADVAQRRLLLTKEPPRTVVFMVGLRGMSVELGDIVLLTTAQGIGPTGWTDRPIFVTRHELNPDKLTVRLEGFDVDRIYSGAYVLGDEAVLPAAWTSATTAQKRYGFLADETTGQFSNGEPGKRLR